MNSNRKNKVSKQKKFRSSGGVESTRIDRIESTRIGRVEISENNREYDFWNKNSKQTCKLVESTRGTSSRLKAQVESTQRSTESTQISTVSYVEF